MQRGMDPPLKTIITDVPEVKMKDQRWFVAALGPRDP